MGYMKIAATFAHILGAACVAALPLWILGVPGQPESDTPFTRGWKMGLQVLWLYPMACVGTRGVWLLAQVLATGEARERWQQNSDIAAVAALAIAAARLGQSFETIRKS